MKRDKKRGWVGFQWHCLSDLGILLRNASQQSYTTGCQGESIFNPLCLSPLLTRSSSASLLLNRLRESVV
jgi:hypothetical protein